MFGKSFFTVEFLILMSALASEDFTCSRTSNDYRCRLNSATPYRFIANNNDTKLIFPGCEAKKIWLFIKHGMGYVYDDIVRLKRKLLDIQEYILTDCKVRDCDIEQRECRNVMNWDLDLEKSEKLIINEGEDEMKKLAKRYQSRFPELMPKIYSESSYKFKFSRSRASKTSAKSFAYNLFTLDKHQSVVFEKSGKKDKSFMYYRMCQKWSNEIAQNWAAWNEFSTFFSSPEYLKVIDNLSHHLGLNVRYDTVNSIRAKCILDISWNKDENSSWCDYLTEHDFAVWEFIEDFERYWIDGYQHELTSKLACPAILDMFYFLRSEVGISASVNFVQSQQLLPLLSLLGIVNDKTPLTPDSFYTSKDRLWRLSLIDAFGSNVAFISYNCESTGLHILTMHQERIVNLPGCPKYVPCPLDIMQSQLPDTNEECNFSTMCDMN